MLSFGSTPEKKNVSTLSQILQIGVPEKYYLSQKACLGILRRASSRGKVLPPLLERGTQDAGIGLMFENHGQDARYTS